MLNAGPALTAPIVPHGNSEYYGNGLSQEELRRHYAGAQSLGGSCSTSTQTAPPAEHQLPNAIGRLLSTLSTLEESLLALEARLEPATTPEPTQASAAKAAEAPDMYGPLVAGVNDAERRIVRLNYRIANVQSRLVL